MALSTQDFNQNRRASDPGGGSKAITPADSLLTTPILSLYVTVAGSVAFLGMDGQADTWTVPANFIIPVAMTQVSATGTTATGLHGIY